MRIANSPRSPKIFAYTPRVDVQRHKNYGVSPRYIAYARILWLTANSILPKVPLQLREPPAQLRLQRPPPGRHIGCQKNRIEISPVLRTNESWKCFQESFPSTFLRIPPAMLKTEHNLRKAAAKPQLPEADQVNGLATKDDVARFCRVSRRTIELWIQQRRIPCIRLGHRLLRFDLPAVKTALVRWSTKEIK